MLYTHPHTPSYDTNRSIDTMKGRENTNAPPNVGVCIDRPIGFQ